MKNNKTVKTTEKTKRYSLRAVLLLIPSILCFLYYMCIILFMNTNTSVIWVWPLASAVFLISAIYIYFFGCPPHNPIVVCAGILVVAFIITFLTFEAMLISASVSDSPGDIECIIVLGAAVKGDVPSKALATRIDAAYDYMSKNERTVAVLSGGKGHGEDISEAECMRRELTKRGIDQSRLILEEKSTSTSENIEFSLDIINSRNYKRISIVTSDFHLLRARSLLKKKYDGEIYGISAPFNNPLILHYAVREFIAYTHDALYGLI